MSTNRDLTIITIAILIGMIIYILLYMPQMHTTVQAINLNSVRHAIIAQIVIQ